MSGGKRYEYITVEYLIAWPSMYITNLTATYQLMKIHFLCV